jgi:hypothetical protein
MKPKTEHQAWAAAAVRAMLIRSMLAVARQFEVLALQVGASRKK